MIERFDPRAWSIECVARLLARPQRAWVELGLIELAWAEFRAAPVAQQRAMAVRLERLVRRSGRNAVFELWDRVVQASEMSGRPSARSLEQRGRHRLAADRSGAQVDFERALELYAARGRTRAAARLHLRLARVLRGDGRTLEASACVAAAQARLEPQSGRQGAGGRLGWANRPAPS